MVFRLWLLYLSCGYLDGAALHSCSWRTFSETGLGSQLGLQESWRDVWRGTPSVYSRPPPSGSHSEMHKIHWITKQANYIEIQFYPQTPWGVPRLRRPARISFQHEIIWFYDQWVRIVLLCQEVAEYSPVWSKQKWFQRKNVLAQPDNPLQPGDYKWHWWTLSLSLCIFHGVCFALLMFLCL